MRIRRCARNVLLGRRFGNWHAVCDGSSAMPDNSELRAALRAYIDAHPDAADGLIGIRQWWLPEHQRYVSVAQLREVLNDLVARGEMSSTPLSSGSELYTRNTDRSR